MASIRPRMDPKRGEDRYLTSKRTGGNRDMSGEGPQSAIPRSSRREMDISRLGGLSSAPTKTSSRKPQDSSIRKLPGSTIPRPSLTHGGQSWDSTSSGSKTPRKVLRRKPSNIARETEDMRYGLRSSSGRTSSSSSVPRSQASLDLQVPQLDRSFTESPVEIKVAQRIELPKVVPQTTVVYPELDRYRDVQVPQNASGTEVLFKLATHDLPPPTPLFSGTSSQMSAFSGSPSTRFSDSPGPGPYSRDTTPTSMSSASPGLIAPVRNISSRGTQASPAETRPPVTRRRAGSNPIEDRQLNADTLGLAVVREALTSSSSNSTVRDGEKKDGGKRRGLSSTAPSPPPRKSSQKFKKDRLEEQSPTRPAKKMTQSAVRSSSAAKKKISPEKSSESATPVQSRPTPPSRPSREGTPDLHSQFGGPMPIIHSNLSSSSISDRRQSGSLAPSSLPKSTIRRSSEDRDGRSKPPIGREPTPVPQPSSGATPSSQEESGRQTRTPSPGVSTFRSRFGLFGRRKTETDVSKAEKKERQPRKGPAAGTGHEGYGRFGALRRRSSNTVPSPGAARRSTGSSDGSTNAQPTDPFLLERLNPVVIAGGEVVENRNITSPLSRTDSNQSLPAHQPSGHSRNASSASASSTDGRNTLWPSALPRTASRSRRPSDSSDSETAVKRSALGFRRSVQRIPQSLEKPPALTQPFMTSAITSPSVGSVATSNFADDSVTDSRSGAGINRRETAAKSKKLTKQTKPLKKWNLFGRSQSQPPAVAKKVAETTPVPVTVEDIPSKPVAFYTMMDSSEDTEDQDQDITDVLRAADVLPPKQTSTNETQVAPHDPNSHFVQEQHHPVHQETAALVRADENAPAPGARTELTAFEMRPVDDQVQQNPGVVRPSRLPQIGRIPKVVNSRPDQASPRSFSRPFNRASIHHLSSGPDVVDQDSIAKGPSPPKPSTPRPTKEAPYLTGSLDSSTLPGSSKQGSSVDLGRPGTEFLVFSPRENTESTATTSSSSSGIPSYVLHTAVIPDPTAPLVEDEIWDEYNDLLGEAPTPASSSRKPLISVETDGSKAPKSAGKSPEPPSFKHQNVKEVRDSIETGKAATSSSHYSGDMTARLNAAFRFSSEPPSTPFSITDFVAGYGDRNKSGDLSKAAAPSKRSSSSSRKSSKLRVSGGSTSSEETPLTQVNLRVGSMTVSKWLTFGHVLFSPAKEDIIPVVGSLKRHSILVVDGLGNDDWSFYAAETYPAATFFNLSPRAPLSEDQRTSTTFPLSPPNHHQIQYTSHMEKFPFAPDSFTTVVYRFPAAAPESHYRNVIAEARRVLEPGGYIELSILDVDFNNMGNRTRRAVRRLKEKVNMQNPEINLSSTADLILRLLGKKGFVDVKTCRVGVPVASAITSSSGTDSDRKKKKKDERSLAEMMNDETETGDENITKMVAKVGRWWYNRLYEVSTAVTPSIWSDRALLAECEEWGTSLKLMVCYARVPQTRGRVSSI